MTIEPDIIVERRRLKRRLSFWRIAAVIAVIAAIAVAGRQGDGGFALTPHIARISIAGLIQDNREQAKLLERLATSDQARAVIVHIDSLGGTTAGGEMLYTGLRRIADKKPVVAVFGTTATSAGYMAGIAADHIVARGNTITGSVGVIIQWPEISEALAKLGIKFEEIKSGPAKAEPSPFHPITEEGRRVAEEMIAESQNWFVGLVAERRKLEAAALADLRTGRIYSGRQALARGLVDALGDEGEARRWLLAVHDINAENRVVDWRPEGEGGFRWLGMDGLAGFLLGDRVTKLAADIAGAVRLDGLTSVWHAGR